MRGSQNQVKEELNLVVNSMAGFRFIYWERWDNLRCRLRPGGSLKLAKLNYLHLNLNDFGFFSLQTPPRDVNAGYGNDYTSRPVRPWDNETMEEFATFIRPLIPTKDTM